MSNLRFALIGPGRVGTALAYLLCKQGFTLTTVVGRSQTSLQRAQGYLRGEGCLTQTKFTTNMKELPDRLDLILLGVRDDQIVGVVHTLWQEQLLRPQQILIHLSGVQPSDAGQLPGMAKIHRLAMHPLQAVAEINAGITQLIHCIWSLEGDAEAVSIGEELLTVLGVRWLRIDREQKALYHAAACMVSNYLVTIAELAVEMLTSVGFSPDLATEAMLPLIEGTVRNLRVKTPREALTGPIARGDAGTVAKHMQTIAETNPDWLLPYAVLGRATLRFAKLTDQKELKSLFLQEIAALTSSNAEKEEY